MNNLEKKKYIVYILKCSDKSFYTGITNDLDKRLAKHVGGKGSKYVRSRLPFKLIYTEECENKSLALKREFYLKGLSKKGKIKELGL